MSRDNLVYVGHIIDTVIRSLKLIGEAVKKISKPVRMQNPEIPWKAIVGMRDMWTQTKNQRKYLS